jgi:K+-transporting ATPase ATPase B chain
VRKGAASAVIAWVRAQGIVILIPLALRGVRYRPASAAKMLSRNLHLYGLGGLVAPFIGIKLIDLLVQFLPGVR